MNLFISHKEYDWGDLKKTSADKHPGPKQHKEYAEKIFNLIKENYHG
jgi:hypothetical protein